MRRSFLIAIVAGVLAGVIVCTRAEDAAKNPPPDSIAVKIEYRVSELRFDGTPFDQALDRLAEMTHANIVVDWPAVEAAGVRRDAPIRLRLYELYLAKVLELVFIEAAGPDSVRPLGFAVDDHGVIHVSTRDALTGVGVARLYNLRDLIDQLYADSTRGLDSDVRVFSRQEGVDAVIGLITNLCSSDTWKNYGGAVGTIYQIGDNFVIVQSPEAHRQIERLLYNLRRINASRARGEKPTTRGIDLLAPPAAEPAKR